MVLKGHPIPELLMITSKLNPSTLGVAFRLPAMGEVRPVLLDLVSPGWKPRLSSPRKECKSSAGGATPHGGVSPGFPLLASFAPFLVWYSFQHASQGYGPSFEFWLVRMMLFFAFGFIMAMALMKILLLPTLSMNFETHCIFSLFAK